MKTVTVISKEDCSLCDKALAKLDSIKQQIPFRLEIRKIEPGTAEYETYKEKIPVVLVDDVEMFYYRVDERRMRDLLSG